MQTDLANKISALASDLQNWRRHLHMHPEPSFQEWQTMDFVCTILEKHGISYQKGVADTGVVAIIRASWHATDATCLALRADLDALPIQELNDVAYKSQNDGWMHACGHDVHTTILLGTAVLLQEKKEELKRPVKLIFQPGEEQSPGGATLMIKAGVLENPHVAEMVALHVYPEMEVGNVGLRSGLYMASSDEIHVEIQGIGGHGALPARFVNPIDIGMAWMQACKSVVSERCPENIPQVLTFGRFEALGSTNVVAGTAVIKGTFRTMDETWRKKVHELLHMKANEVAASYGAQINLTIAKGYPFLKNDPDLTQRVASILRQALGSEKVHELELRMTAEDFAFYSQERPVCFFRLGVGNAQMGIVHAVHHPRFDIDESALEIGVQCMLKIALS
ncbi:MAG: M20 family metallopeptidase [Flavobacteriales bacterium]